MLNGYSKKSQSDQVQSIEEEWASERWQDITRPYSAEDVARLRGSVQIEHTLASRGAEGCGRCSRARTLSGRSGR